MTEKLFRVHDIMRFNYSEIGQYIDENHTDKPLRNDEIVNLLNQQHEEIQELNYILRNEMDIKIQYKQRVIEVLQKYYKLYANMAVELRHDKYSNGVYHNVLEVLEEIADELGVALNDC